MKPTVVVTGSDGLLGTKLLQRLHGRYNLVGLDNDPDTEVPGYHDLILCDLTDAASVAHGFDRLRERHGDRIASFVHLAAYYDFGGEESPLYRKLTIDGTRRVLNRLQDFQVDQFVFSSTMLVMEPSDGGEPLTEDSPLQGEWAYPQSKIEAERLIRHRRGPIPAVLLRIAGVYDDWGRAVPIAQQFRRIYEKQFESYFFPGDPSHGQSMVHLKDAVASIECAIERRDRLSGVEPFLIGEPDVLTFAELQDAVGELLHGDEWPTIRVPKPLARIGAEAMDAVGVGDDFIQPWMVEIADQDYRVDVSKAERLLGWRPRRRLRDTLPRIAAHLLDDPETWYRENGVPVPESVGEER